MKSLAEVVYPQWMGKHRKWTMTYAVNSSAPTAEWDVNSSFRWVHLEGLNPKSPNIPHLDTSEDISTVGRFHFEAEVLKKKSAHTEKAARPWNPQLQKWWMQLKHDLNFFSMFPRWSKQSNNDKTKSDSSAHTHTKTPTWCKHKAGLKIWLLSRADGWVG